MVLLRAISYSCLAVSQQNAPLESVLIPFYNKNKVGHKRGPGFSEITHKEVEWEWRQGFSPCQSQILPLKFTSCFILFDFVYIILTLTKFFRLSKNTLCNPGWSGNCSASSFLTLIRRWDDRPIPPCLFWKWDVNPCLGHSSYFLLTEYWGEGIIERRALRDEASVHSC